MLNFFVKKELLIVVILSHTTKAKGPYWEFYLFGRKTITLLVYSRLRNTPMLQGALKLPCNLIICNRFWFGHFWPFDLLAFFLTSCIYNFLFELLEFWIEVIFLISCNSRVQYERSVLKIWCSFIASFCMI